jgi:tripartite-type tricarboxylate transporter receptor subunit TctC
MAHRRTLLLGSMAALPAGPRPAWAQNPFPARPVRLIVPYGAGGASDIIARAMAAAAPQGVTFVVENRGGGASIPGTQAIATAEPDGYTIGVVDTALVINPGLFGPRLPYDTERDFAPIGELATSPLVFCANPAVPSRNLAEWLAWAHAQPALNLGHAGNGTAVHLATAQLTIAAGLKAEMVAYRGGGPMIPALLAKEIPAGFLSVPAARPHVEAGRLRALAVTSPQPSPALPDVPGFAQAGLPSVDALPLFGAVAPAATPAAAIRRLHALLVEPAGRPEVKARLETLGYEVAAGSPEQFAAVIRREIAKWREVIARAGIQPD